MSICCGPLRQQTTKSHKRRSPRACGGPRRGPLLVASGAPAREQMRRHHRGSERDAPGRDTNRVLCSVLLPWSCSSVKRFRTPSPSSLSLHTSFAHLPLQTEPQPCPHTLLCLRESYTLIPSLQSRAAEPRITV
jgi:hypothetical protein